MYTMHPHVKMCHNVKNCKLQDLSNHRTENFPKVYNTLSLLSASVYVSKRGTY